MNRLYSAVKGKHTTAFHVNNCIRRSLSTTTASASNANDEKYYVVQYDYVEGILEKRAPHREAHLSLIQSTKSFITGGIYIYIYIYIYIIYTCTYIFTNEIECSPAELC